MKIEELWVRCPRCGGSGTEGPINVATILDPKVCRECGGKKGWHTETGQAILPFLQFVARFELTSR